MVASNSIANIENTSCKRVVIIGAGFAGLTLAKELCKHDFQIVLLDKNNYHQFQPLFYQVATAALEPSAISFPLRRIFKRSEKLHFRVCEVEQVDTNTKVVFTNIGSVNYDYLVVATGADTNFFDNEKIKSHAFPMKSIAEALQLRNHILSNYEKALGEEEITNQKALLNVVIVGAGPTGVELAGALAELKGKVLPEDYPELDFRLMEVILIEGGGRVLGPFSQRSSKRSHQYLEKLGVDVRLNQIVKDYDGEQVVLSDDSVIKTNTLIWAAGVTGIRLNGFKDEDYVRGNRLQVDAFNELPYHKDVFALGDIAYMEEDAYPNGHPQVAQVAMQQAKHLSRNLKNIINGQELKPFSYTNKGSMATIGKNLAVADLPGTKLSGFIAWILWLFVHLFSIVGAKNKATILIDWGWSYFTADQSLRLLIVPNKNNKKVLKPIS